MREVVFNLIEEYLDGRIDRSQLLKELTAEEKQTIDADIALVSDTRIAFEAAALRGQLHEEFLSDIRKEEGAAKKMNPRTERRLGYWLMGLAAGIIFGVVGYLQFVNETNSIGQYAFVDEGLPVVMSGRADTYAFDDAMTYFKEGRFDVASKKFQQIAEEGSASDTLIYYLGAAQYYAGEFDKSTMTWAELGEGSAFRYRAEYLSLYHAIELGDKARVKELCEDILLRKDHPFYQRAKSVIRESKILE